MKPKLYLDEDVNPRLVVLLRPDGYDVISARDAGALGESDRQQFTRARSSGRVIFSYNYYHFDLIAREEATADRPHFGIIVSYHQYEGHELGDFAAAMRALLAGRDSTKARSSSCRGGGQANRPKTTPSL